MTFDNNCIAILQNGRRRLVAGGLDTQYQHGQSSSTFPLLFKARNAYIVGTKGRETMEIRTDFLVIGSGLAGLSFAIKASRFGSVAIITKKNTTESSTNYAQGGIAAVMDAEDSFDLHIGDTLKAGAGLCREDVVRFVVSEGPERIAELIDWGVEFSRKAGTEASLRSRKRGRPFHAEGPSRSRFDRKRNRAGPHRQGALHREYPDLRELPRH